LSQAEAGLQFLSPAFLEFAVNGTAAQRVGATTEPYHAPSGAYPTDNPERWIAIDVDSHEAWSALRFLLAPVLDDPEFDTLIGRIRVREKLNGLVASWTVTRTAQTIEKVLQNAGVAAHVIASDEDIAYDPGLEALGHYKPVVDPLLGEITIPGPHCVFGGEAPSPSRAGPLIGDSTEAILMGRLGLAASEIARLRADGVID
jgi:benzylsuccinate CoA-transferase BbsF subunit